MEEGAGRMLLSEFISESVSDLALVYPLEEARAMVNLLCEEVLGTRSYTHIVDPGYTVPDVKTGFLTEAVRRMKGKEPVQYILGKAYFAGREFRVSPEVLVPRVETEQLCSIIASDHSNVPGRLRILDLCTGSGCIAWTLAADIPGSEVYACDISDGALQMAGSQDIQTEVSPSFFKADVLSGELPVSGMFDIIVSNPPYVMESEKLLMDANVLDYEPHLALFVDDDNPLVFYKALADLSVRYLSGTGYAEINEQLGKECMELFESYGFRNVEVIHDLRGKERFVRFAK